MLILPLDWFGAIQAAKTPILARYISLFVDLSQVLTPQVHHLERCLDLFNLY